MSYAIIAIGGKQYRVREGEWLLVDRLPYEEGATFNPDVLLVAGDGEARVGADEVRGAQVTARVAAHVLGKKVIVGKHRRRTGYRRRNGHRSRLSRIEIESVRSSAGEESKAGSKKTDAKKGEKAEGKKE